MVHYRRLRIPGGCYFFTVTLRDRRSELLVTHVDALRIALKALVTTSPVQIDAMVVLPDHLHTIWTLPPGDYNYSRRWQFVKSRFTSLVRQRGDVGASYRKGEYRLWQSRFWEHHIVDETDFGRHVDYIHYNPVKHGLVQRPRDWRWSSVHRFVKEGRLPPDWGGSLELQLADSAKESDFQRP